VKPGWTQATLAELTQPVAKVDPKSEFRGTNIAYVDISAIDRDVKRIPGATVVAATDAPSRARQLLRRGDVLVSTVRPNLNAVATVGPELDGAIGSTGFTVLRPNGALDGRYLFHWVTTKAFVRSMAQQATGASYPAVSDGIVKAARIPLPPLDEQRRIAHALDVADHIRSRSRESLNLVLSLLDTGFLQAFGDPARNTRDWPVTTVGEVGTVITGNTPARSDPANYGGDIGWVKNDDVRDDRLYVTTPTESLSELGVSRGRVAQGGSILVTCISGSPPAIGRVAMTGEKLAFNQQINAVVPDEVDPRFLCAQLRLLRAVLRKASTGGMKGLISKSSLRRVPLIMPPRATQEMFGRVFDEVAAQLTRCEHRGAPLNELLASLQHRAFNGEL
jgi:type I restriction enzyme S subunit